MEQWARDRESEGHTPSVAEQCRWLAHASHVRIPSDEIAESLDRLIASVGVRIAPGAIRALDRLRDAGIPLGLISNLLHGTADGSRELLDSFGLLDKFSVLVFSDEYRWSKPRPEPFRFALRRLGAPPSESAHVGDLAYDILGSRRAGMLPLLYTGLHPLEPMHLRKLAYAVDPGVIRLNRWSQVADRVLGRR